MNTMLSYVFLCAIWEPPWISAAHIYGGKVYFNYPDLENLS